MASGESSSARSHIFQLYRSFGAIVVWEVIYPSDHGQLARWCRWSYARRVGEWAKPHSPTLPSLHICHSLFSNTSSIASPRSQALRLGHLARCRCKWHSIKVLRYSILYFIHAFSFKFASTAVEQVVACALVTQWARVRSPVGTSFLGEVFSGFFLTCKTNVRKL